MRRLAAIILAATLCAWYALPAGAQSFPRKYLSANGTNSTSVTGNRTMLKYLLPVNTTTTIYYLKFYNKATAPTCGTDTPLWTVPVPYGTSSAGAASGGGASVPIPDGLMFPSGLGICLTSGIADNDTGAAAAGVAINLGLTGY